MGRSLGALYVVASTVGLLLVSTYFLTLIPLVIVVRLQWLTTLCKRAREYGLSYTVALDDRTTAPCIRRSNWLKYDTCAQHLEDDVLYL